MLRINFSSHSCFASQECSEGEVFDVHWFPTGQCFAVGGTDRKVRIYDIVSGKQEKKFVFLFFLEECYTFILLLR